MDMRDNPNGPPPEPKAPVSLWIHRYNLTEKFTKCDIQRVRGLVRAEIEAYILRCDFRPNEVGRILLDFKAKIEWLKKLEEKAPCFLDEDRPPTFGANSWDGQEYPGYCSGIDNGV